MPDVLPGLAEETGAQRWFLVASKALAEATDSFADLQHTMTGRGADFSANIRCHTPREDVLQVLEEVRVSKAKQIC